MEVTSKNLVFVIASEAKQSITRCSAKACMDHRAASRLAMTVFRGALWIFTMAYQAAEIHVSAA